MTATNWTCACGHDLPAHPAPGICLLCSCRYFARDPRPVEPGPTPPVEKAPLPHYPCFICGHSPEAHPNGGECKVGCPCAMYVMDFGANAHPLEPAPSSEAAIRAERGLVYGPAQPTHANIGIAWSAILRQAGVTVGLMEAGPIPAHVVAAMMAALKLIRGVTDGGKYQADSYLDAKVYIGFVDEFHPLRPQSGTQEGGPK